jgi:hypothetical protein
LELVPDNLPSDVMQLGQAAAAAEVVVDHRLDYLH